jgi:hypothetical protein
MSEISLLSGLATRALLEYVKAGGTSSKKSLKLDILRHRELENRDHSAVNTMAFQTIAIRNKWQSRQAGDPRPGPKVG